MKTTKLNTSNEWRKERDRLTQRLYEIEATPFGSGRYQQILCDKLKAVYDGLRKIEQKPTISI